MTGETVPLSELWPGIDTEESSFISVYQRLSAVKIILFPVASVLFKTCPGA